jgi:hypothetical protein
MNQKPCTSRLPSRARITSSLGCSKR